MKTILQIAKEIGVSKQSVYKRYKGKLHTKVYPYVHIKSGVTYIEKQGEDIIKRDFLDETAISGQPHTERIQDTLLDTVSDTPDTPVDILISMLQAELEIKNKQIEELTATIKIQAESINAANKNELAETIMDVNKKLLEDGKSKNKPGIFKKLFSKKK